MEILLFGFYDPDDEPVETDDELEQYWAAVIEAVRALCEADDGVDVVFDQVGWER